MKEKEGEPGRGKAGNVRADSGSTTGPEGAQAAARKKEANVYISKPGKR